MDNVSLFSWDPVNHLFVAFCLFVLKDSHVFPATEGASVMLFYISTRNVCDTKKEKMYVQWRKTLPRCILNFVNRDGLFESSDLFHCLLSRLWRSVSEEKCVNVMSLKALHKSVVISSYHSLCVQCGVCMAQLQILRRQLTTFVMAHHDSCSRHNDTQFVFFFCLCCPRFP